MIAKPGESMMTGITTPTSSRPARGGFTLIELLVVIAIIAVLTALLLPAVQSARGAAAKAQCQNNQKQIGLALHNFHETNNVFPASGWTMAGPGNPAGKYVGWRPLILPYLEQGNLRKLYNVNLNWWEGTNAVTAAVPVPTFLCPSAPSRNGATMAIAKAPRPAMVFANPVAPNDYEAIMGVQPASINPHLPTPLYTATNRFSIMSRNSTARFKDVRDGTSMTIAVVECAARPKVYRGQLENTALSNDQGICWADSEGPFSLDGGRADGSAEGCGPAGGCNRPMNVKNDNEPYSFHSGGGNFLFVDGRVKFVNQSINFTVFAAMCTMNANEVIPPE
jgi:prepilin-type N-terminal cleavage/methylation domain-containing protein/prepilin-type processing-associated H-X9-DG protein